MKMFPHSFAPFHRSQKQVETSKIAIVREPTGAALEQDSSIGIRPIRIDVERAIDIMLTASAVKNDNKRQKCRLNIIKNLPADCIDWDTVDWVQAWPFQTARL